MKKVLIVGENSYIGTSFFEYAKDRFAIATVCAKCGAWKNISFRDYDAILHVAGIAHSKATTQNESQYFEINCALPIAVSRKAKSDGVKQFVFLSSLLVYTNKMKKSLFIDNDTLPNPSTIYGKSKWAAEQGLQEEASEDFKVAIVRPPLVFGPNAKGNYQSLVKLAKFLPFFPNYPNQRSMIYIDNLCEHLCQLIEYEKTGLSRPHHSEYISTTYLVQEIRRALGKGTVTMKFLNPLINFLVPRSSIFNKMFGDLGYVMQGDESEYNKRVTKLWH